MRRMLLICLICMLIVNICSSVQVNASVSVNASSAILMDQDTGRVLFEKDANRESRIASITKIMTAILAIESGKLHDTVKVSDNAIRTEGSSLYLKAGEKRKLETLVYGLMLRSGNDASRVIAEAVGGSVEGFVFLMNQKARELGMNHTNFDNPNGLDTSDNHYSTAYDMAVLTKYAMQNPTYRKISGTKTYQGWKNKNRLLTEKYKYSTGGKTGFTKLAKRTLVSTATKGDEHLIVVTLNDPDDWNDHINLFEYGFKNYQSSLLLEKGEIDAVQTKMLKGRVFVKHDVVYPLLKKEESEIKIDYQLLRSYKKWRKEKDIPPIVGKAVVYKGSEVIRALPIYYQYTEVKKKKSWFSGFIQILLMQAGVKKDG